MRLRDIVVCEKSVMGSKKYREEATFVLVLIIAYRAHACGVAAWLRSSDAPKLRSDEGAYLFLRQS